MKTALKLFDNEEIDTLARNLKVDREELVRDIIGTAADKRLVPRYTSGRIIDTVGWVRAAAELGSGIYAEIEVLDELGAARLVEEPPMELAAAMLIGHEDKALHQKYTAFITEVAFVRERVVTDRNRSFRQR